MPHKQAAQALTLSTLDPPSGDTRALLPKGVLAALVACGALLVRRASPDRLAGLTTPRGGTQQSPAWRLVRQSMETVT